jgi:hypothetical protein
VFTKWLAEHDDNEGDDDERQEVGFEFLIARGDSAELLDFIEQPFDFVALLVAVLIIDDEIQAVRLGRDDRSDAFSVELGADGVTVIGLVHRRLLDAVVRIDGLDERFTDRRVPDLSSGDADSHRIGLGSAQGMDFRRQSAAGAAQGLLAFFWAAPAAC